MTKEVKRNRRKQKSANPFVKKMLHGPFFEKDTAVVTLNATRICFYRNARISIFFGQNLRMKKRMFRAKPPVRMTCFGGFSANCQIGFLHGVGLGRAAQNPHTQSRRVGHPKTVLYPYKRATLGNCFAGCRLLAALGLVPAGSNTLFFGDFPANCEGLLTAILPARCEDGIEQRDGSAIGGCE
jgi:hypothetical protein